MALRGVVREHRLGGALMGGIIRGGPAQPYAAPVKPRRLSFFNEQDPDDLDALCQDEATRRQLRALGASVTMGLRDLSDARAHAVRRLTDDGVPVGAWLLLPREHGYFATHDNAAAVEARADEVLCWAARHHLRLESLGLDFEPDLRELEAFFERPARALRSWSARAGDRRRRDAALARYGALVGELQAAGWRVESYQFPLLLEDRRAGSSFFQRFAGALDVPVQREVVMVYSSLLGPLGLGLLDAWAPGASAVAVGSTGGGVDPLPKLSWDELGRDLRLAARACDDVSVFSLEGCVQRGYLERLLDLDWSAPVEVPRLQRAGARAVTSAARVLSRLLR